MTDELDLTVPARKTSERRSSRIVPVLLTLVLLAVVANILLTTKRSAGPARQQTAGLSADKLEELALRFEKQGLNARAAETWQDYVAAAGPGAEDCARIWYRIGKLWQDADEHEQALAGFYRSESFATLTELDPELGRRIQDSLEALGKFAALRHELTERVSLDDAAAAAGDEVVARIGTQTITAAELDRAIEAQIERQLTQFAGRLSDEARNEQKEEMFTQLSSGQERLRMLNQLVLEEILYRQARELKLTDDPEIRALLKDLERSALAQKVIEKELADQIKITEGDVRTYYEANRQEYVRPERAQLSHILVPDEAAAQALIEELKAGADFEALAKERSTDKSTAQSGGRIDGWAEKGGVIPGLGYSDEATRLIFETDALIETPIKTGKGYHVVKVTAREPEQQKAFEAVREQAFSDLHRQKEREVQERLLRDLHVKYDVVIHQSTFMPEPPESAGGAP